LELDELSEVNEIDIKILKEKNKCTPFSFINDNIKDKEYIQPIENYSESVLFLSKDKSNQTYRSEYFNSENERSQISFNKSM
jgi:hypothetical protein